MTENLDLFIQDFGVNVTKGASTIIAIFDAPDEFTGGGLVVSTEYTLTAKSSDVSSWKYGDTVTIASEGYEVRSTRKIEDGSFTKVMLAKT